MLWLGCGLFLAGVAVIVYAVVHYLLAVLAESGTSTLARAGQPLIRASHFFGVLLATLAPDWVRQREERDKLFLAKAGLEDLLEPVDAPGAVLAAAVTGSLICPLLYSLSVTTMVLGFLGGAIMCCLWFRSRRLGRQALLVREFPTAVDVICVAISGGLDFGQAMKEIAENMEEGPVVHEFNRIQREISMGASRSDALRRFSSRVDAIEIRAFVISLVQTIEVGGAGLRDALRIQSEQLRFNRLMRAEEAANKVPSKMTIPMMLFIIPCIFLIIGVPLGIQVVSTWKGMSGK